MGADDGTGESGSPAEEGREENHGQEAADPGAGAQGRTYDQSSHQDDSHDGETNDNGGSKESG
jgi:hypothetical protein